MSDILSDEGTKHGVTDNAQEDARSTREKLLVDIWKQAVDTQKHFNDMCVKSRQLGLTFVAASLGAALYLFIRSPGGLNEGSQSSVGAFAYALPICGHSVIIHVSLAIVLAAFAAVVAVKKLDLDVYHQMLRGAVTFGEDLEEVHILPMIGLEKGMTQAISHFSRNSDAKAERGKNGHYLYIGSDRKNALEKLKGFYRVIMIFLAVLGVVIFFASNFLKAV